MSTIVTQLDHMPVQGYKFSVPGVVKIDVAPHGGDWTALVYLEDAQAIISRKEQQHTGPALESVLTLLSATLEDIEDAIPLNQDRDHDEEVLRLCAQKKIIERLIRKLKLKSAVHKEIEVALPKRDPHASTGDMVHAWFATKGCSTAVEQVFGAKGKSSKD